MKQNIIFFILLIAGFSVMCYALLEQQPIAFIVGELIALSSIVYHIAALKRKSNTESKNTAI